MEKVFIVINKEEREREESRLNMVSRLNEREERRAREETPGLSQEVKRPT